VIRLYPGGSLDRSSRTLWATPDSDYAAAFAQLHEGELWMLTLDVRLAPTRTGHEPPLGLSEGPFVERMELMGRPSRYSPEVRERAI